LCSVSAKYPEEAPQVREKHNTHQKEVRALTFVRLHVLVLQQLVGAHHQLQLLLLHQLEKMGGQSPTLC
jgi:hypothetical protein